MKLNIGSIQRMITGNQENQSNGNSRQSERPLFDDQTITSITLNIPNSYLIIVDEDLNINFLSGQKITKNKIDVEQFLRSPIQNWFGPGLSPIYEGIHQALDGKTSDLEVDIAEAFYHIHLIPLQYANSARRVMIIAEDITEMKQIQLELENRIGALTKPIQDVSDVSFTDLFNVKDIQRIQDRFAQATGIASIITLPDGTPVTRPSNFCRLCREFIRSNRLGEKRCNLSDATVGKYNPTGPTVRPCMSSGLWNAGASITVGGQHIANWLIGQVRNETQSEEKMRRYAREIEADEEEFIKAYYEVPTMSIVQFKKISEVLFIMAEQLSNLAYQNVQQARFISEREQVEKELHESEQRYHNYVNRANCGVMTLDLTGSLIDVNQVACCLAGYAENELDHKKLQDLFLPEDSAMVEQFQALLRDDPPGFMEARILKKDGAIRWWRIETTRLSSKTILAYMIDISDRKFKEEAVINVQM